MTVLSVAYPLAPVRPDAVGGAEQIVSYLDRGLVRRGHRSIVIACEGSSVQGELIATPRGGAAIDAGIRARAGTALREAVCCALARGGIDVVHVHGHDFDRYLPPPGVPVLATLHLPPELTESALQAVTRPDTWMHGVSSAQHRRLPPSGRLLPPIENGVDVDALPRRVRRRSFALSMGRICAEKGFHLALQAARQAGTPAILAGVVFPFEAHQRYFADKVQPLLDRTRRLVGAVSVSGRRRLLNAARCVVIPSLVEETSSLVAMEAIACGTPAVARRIGALPEIVEEGVTGFLVESVEQMAQAIQRAGDIDADACRSRALSRFSAERMVDAYLRRYNWLVAGESRTAVPA